MQSLNIDEPFVRQTSAGNEYYHTDALGSTLALSNTAAATTVSYDYEPFGKTTVNGTSTNPFQYTGRENDGGGLYHYRQRYYAPGLHRFLGEDPLEFLAGDTNLYAYVLNTSLNLTDPNGLAVVYQGPPPPGCESPQDKQEKYITKFLRGLVCAFNFLPAGGAVTGPATVITATKGVTRPLAMDAAVARAANHVRQGGRVEITPGGNVQFRSTTTIAAGQTERELDASMSTLQTPRSRTKGHI